MAGGDSTHGAERRGHARWRAGEGRQCGGRERGQARSREKAGAVEDERGQAQCRAQELMHGGGRERAGSVAGQAVEEKVQQTRSTCKPWAPPGLNL